MSRREGTKGCGESLKTRLHSLEQNHSACHSHLYPPREEVARGHSNEKGGERGLRTEITAKNYKIKSNHKARGSPSAVWVPEQEPPASPAPLPQPRWHQSQVTPHWEGRMLWRPSGLDPSTPKCPGGKASGLLTPKAAAGRSFVQPMAAGVKLFTPWRFLMKEENPGGSRDSFVPGEPRFHGTQWECASPQT